ncbi:charged multivesicular body protein 6-A [Culicoides brevitarsis]|uniref:charged multivesicular body protein 6-A n=1 Tax=Culicoides brevitarsis TaxID=469753 RepID=UPI00307B39A7
MGGIFGKAKKDLAAKITEQDKAILQLKQQRDKLKQYQKRVENSLESDRLLAKKCLEKGNKDRARLLLRKKKYQEKLLQNADSQLEAIEKMTSDLEFAVVELDVVNTLKVGNEALKKVNDIMSIDDIERILDETREGVEKQQEIDALISGALTDEDEENILEELDRLVEEEKRDRIEYIDEDIGDQLPEVPQDALPEKEKAKKARKASTEKIALEA